jgi:hypothetical protein
MGCSGGTTQPREGEQQTSESAAIVHVQAAENPTWLRMKARYVYPHHNQNGEHGMLVRIAARPVRSSPDTSGEGFWLFGLVLLDTNGRALPLFAQPETQARSMNRGPNTEFTCDLFLPYRFIPLQAGKQRVQLGVWAAPLAADSAQHLLHNWRWNGTDSTDLAPLRRATELTAAFTYTQPTVFREQLVVYRIALDTTNLDPSQSDFHIPEYGGTGYPDLYWAAYIGHSFVGRGQRHRNCLDCSRREETELFPWAEGDQLRLLLMDRDLFSMDDELGEIVLPIPRLSTNPRAPSVLKGGAIGALVINRVPVQNPL